ncbi:MAG: HD domain-containing protein [Spirochaetales bacterium]|nr:HD domain-containing protein [Spirochaetales bacterium]
MQELEPVDENSPHDIIDLSLLSTAGVKHWTNIFSKSPIPLVLLNKKLQIIWYNQKFNDLFGRKIKFQGIRIDHFFIDSIEKSELERLYNNIRSPQTDYFWRGKVEKRGVRQFSIISNLLILPVFQSPKDIKEPIAYAGILDNISEQHREMLRLTFMSLLEASRLKDNDTGNHIQRVNHYSRIIAEELHNNSKFKEVDLEYIENISFLAAMHDVGKIGTPDDILNKKGSLEDWEWEIMKEHTINGAFILSTYPNPMAKEIALHHHEKWNGTGYPYGISQEMIPLAARIVAIADVYDALRMKRSYKDAYSHVEVKTIIAQGNGIHFDPYLIDRFMKVESRFAEIYDQLKD